VNPKIGAPGAKSIATIIQKNPQLEAVNIESNKFHNTHQPLIDCSISDEGATAIAESLMLNSSIQLLNLSINNLTPNCSESIGKALAFSKSLTHLHIGSMNFF
jgi:hypothetical protein